MSSLTQARLKELLNYDPLTGIFTWRVWKGANAPAGSVAGGLHAGYWSIKIDGRNYQAHRLAVFYVTGSWPKHLTDHRDLDKGHNAWENLREATHGQNKCNSLKYANNTSGFKGVHWHRRDKKWTAAIQVEKRRISLGYHDTPELAHAAYCEAAVIHHGEYARTA